MAPTIAMVQQDPKYRTLQKEMINVSKDLRTSEQKITYSEKKLAELDQGRNEIYQTLTKQHTQLQQLLSTVQHLAKRGPGALMETSKSIDDLIRSTMILKSLIGKLAAANKNLQQELKRLGSLRFKIQQEQENLKRGQEKLGKQSQKIEGLLNERKIILERERDQQRKIEERLKTLAAQSSNVHDLIVQLKKQKPASKSTSKPIDQLRKKEPISGLQKEGRYVMLPIQGEVIAKYGKSHELNLEGAGIVFKSHPNARVLSPVNGQVVFAGPFRRYSQIIIIAHDGKYHTLLAGMKRLDTASGQQVMAGEPIGLMGDGKEDDKADKPYLYLELRRDSTPIDPTLWITDI